MTETFFTADTHFGHQNIIAFDETRSFRQFATIEEHDAELVRRWNAVVGRKDNVWHLGDFCFGKHSLAIAADLNGVKRLVIGNHDMYPAEDYLRYFKRVCGVVQYKGLVLSHVPVHPDELLRWKANVHGHLHQRTIADPRFVCVSVEQTDLAPIPYEEVERRLAAEIL